MKCHVYIRETEANIWRDLVPHRDAGGEGSLFHRPSSHLSHTRETHITNPSYTFETFYIPVDGCWSGERTCVTLVADRAMVMSAFTSSSWR